MHAYVNTLLFIQISRRVSNTNREREENVNAQLGRARLLTSFLCVWADIIALFFHYHILSLSLSLSLCVCVCECVHSPYRHRAFIARAGGDLNMDFGNDFLANMLPIDGTDNNNNNKERAPKPKAKRRKK